MSINFLNFENITKTVRSGNFAQNPISFRGGSKPDTFEKSQSCDVSYKDKIAALNAQAQDIQEQIDSLTSQISKYKKSDKNGQRAFSQEHLQLCRQRNALSKQLASVNHEIKTCILQVPHIKNTRTLALESGIDEEAFKLLLKHGALESYMCDNIAYIDTKSEKNAPLFSRLEAKKGEITESYKLARKYNISPKKMAKMLENGDIIALGLSGVKKEHVLIDETAPINAHTINKHRKHTPVYTLRYPQNSWGDCVAKEVSPAYLVSLGFGTMNEMKAAFKSGALAGSIKSVKTEKGTKRTFSIDMSDEATRKELISMRNNNPNIVEKKQLLSSLDMRQKQLELAIDNDECEIVSEFVFDKDKNKVYFDLSNPKNKEFYENAIFERDLRIAMKDEQKEKSKLERSLQMKIAWALSPNTRSAAKSCTYGDPALIEVFAKVENGEEISEEEEIMLKSYYKRLWKTVGKEEFSNARVEAKIIVQKLKTYGIESIKDPVVLQVIEGFYENIE